MKNKYNEDVVSSNRIILCCAPKPGRRKEKRKTIHFFHRRKEIPFSDRIHIGSVCVCVRAVCTRRNVSVL